MDPVKKKNICKAAFNAANYNALGAVALSIGMGSSMGTALFVLAAVAGTLSKYRALAGDSYSPGNGRRPNILRKLADDPALTAKILMLAAAFNFIGSVIDVGTGIPEERPGKVCMALSWLCGLAGDNAIRVNDGLNFGKDAVAAPQEKSDMRKAFEAASANPSLFYGVANIALLGATLAGKSLFSFEGYCGMALAGIFAAGVLHAARKTWQAAHGRIEPEQVNDGGLNALAMAGLGGQSLLAAYTGYGWVAASQAIFAGSNLKTLDETRSALAKKNAAPALKKS